MSNGRKARPVARVAPDDRWFPSGIRDVVAHTDGRLVSLTVARVRDGTPQVLMREFEAAPTEAAFREICRWLRAIGSASGSPEDQVLDWSVDVASRIVDAMSQG